MNLLRLVWSWMNSPHCFCGCEDRDICRKFEDGDRVAVCALDCCTKDVIPITVITDRQFWASTHVLCAVCDSRLPGAGWHYLVANCDPKEGWYSENDLRPYRDDDYAEPATTDIKERV